MSIATKLSMMTGNSRLLPFDRGDPSLVLYLPLWYPAGDMTGSTIYSYDTYRHSCAVTGALWTPRGRSFDGDDKINCGQQASLYIVNGTIEFWSYLTAPVGNGYLFDIRDGVAGVGYAYYAANSLGVSAGTKYIDLVATNTFTYSAWHHFAISGITFSGTGPLLIGVKYTLTEFAKGTIGEVRIYNRALSAVEIMNNFLATKWRYT